MATNFSQENVEEDAADLCFPKDKKVTARSSQFSAMKPIKLFEKFPSLPERSQARYGINFLLSVSGEDWFLWNGRENSIITGSISQVLQSNNNNNNNSSTEKNNINRNQHKEWPLKTLIPFDVTNLSVHPVHRGHVLIWGKLGVAVAHVPLQSISSPTSKSNTSGSSSLQPTAKSRLVGEKVYLDSPKIRTCQAKWHPDTAYKMIAVLHNDYHLRFYNSENPLLPITQICVGPLTMSREIGDHDHFDGEVPVDFDFGPQLPKSKFWTIFILREFGDIYYVLARILGDGGQSYTEIHGPLNTSGEFDDKLSSMVTKYTSILSTKNFPIVLATGNLSNTLQHALLLPDDLETADECNMEEKVLKAELSLYIREKIILETVCESDINYLTLVADPAIEHRYTCVTETGIYLVNVNFIPEVRSFLKSSGEQEIMFCPTNPTESTVKFLLCWKVNDESKARSNACLTGLSFCDTLSQKLLIILGDMRAILCDVSCPISSLFPSSNGKFQDDSISRASPFSVSKTFIEEERDVLNTIQNILKRTANQPFMFSTQDIQGEELEKFGLDSIDLLVREYIEREEEAMHYLKSTVKRLVVKTDLVKDSLNELSQSRQELRRAAESIAENYEERACQNEELQKRLEDALHRQQQSLPSTTFQEIQWKKKLEELQKDTNVFRKWIEAIKLKVKVEQNESERGGVSSLNLPKLESKTVSEIRKQIFKHHESIQKLSKEIKELQHTVETL